MGPFQGYTWPSSRIPLAGGGGGGGGGTGSGGFDFVNTERVSAPGMGYADARIANALQRLQAGDGPAHLILDRGNYPLNGEVPFTWWTDKDIYITSDGATIDCRPWEDFGVPTYSSALYFFNKYVDGSNGWVLESPVTAGDTEIEVPAGVAAELGSDGRGVLVFRAETVDGGSTHDGNDNGYGHGEQAVVWQVDGTTAKLATFLREGYGKGTHVYPYRYPHVSIDGARVLMSPAGQWAGITMLGAMAPRVTNSYVEGAQYVCFLVVNNIAGQIDNCLADTLGWRFFDGSVYGYGIGPSEGFMLTNSHARRCKHALATSGYLPAWDVHVENCDLNTERTGVGTIGIRTHHSSRNLTLVNVRTHGLSHVGSGRLTVIGGEYTGGNKAMDGTTTMAIPSMFLASQVTGIPHDITITGATLDAGGYLGRTNAHYGIYMSESNAPQWYRRVAVSDCTIMNCVEGIRIIPSYQGDLMRIDQLSVTNCRITSNSYPISISDSIGPVNGYTPNTTLIKKLDVVGGVLRTIEGSQAINFGQATPVEELTVDTDWQVGPQLNGGLSLTGLRTRSDSRFDAATNAARVAAGTVNARLDAIESVAGASNVIKVFTGPMPAACSDPNTGTLLVTINLPADWMEAAGVTLAARKYKLGTWSGVAVVGGKAGYARRYSSDGTTCREQVPVTRHGFGGLLTFDDEVFTLGMTVQIDGWLYHDMST